MGRWVQDKHRDYKTGPKTQMLVLEAHRLCVSFNSRLERDKDEEEGVP